MLQIFYFLYRLVLRHILHFLIRFWRFSVTLQECNFEKQKVNIEIVEAYLKDFELKK